MISAIGAVERDERQRQLIEDATELAGDTGEQSRLIGYTLLCLYSDGATRTAGYRPSPCDHQLGAALYDAWARATLEKHFVFGEGVDAAHAVLEGRA